MTLILTHEWLQCDPHKWYRSPKVLPSIDELSKTTFDNTKQIKDTVDQIPDTPNESSTAAPLDRSINGWNAEYLDAMYNRWSMDPASVETPWQRFFEGFDLGTRVAENETNES